MHSELIVGAILLLVLNEMVDVCPWLAGKVVRLAARRIPDPPLACRFEEEWLAVVNGRPGKLLKLATALNIAILGARQVRSLSRGPKPAVGLEEAISQIRRRALVGAVVLFVVNGVATWSLISVSTSGAMLWGSIAVSAFFVLMAVGILLVRAYLGRLRRQVRAVLEIDEMRGGQP